MDADQAGEQPPVLSAACEYLARGWRVIAVPRGEKGPIQRGWQRLRIPVSDLARHFKTGQENIGLLLGEPSGGLVDVDLDASHAVAAAPTFLPPTGRRHGRAGKPYSHWWYVADPIPRAGTWKDTDGAMLCELRSTGQQTIVPPSLHPSGEPVAWHEASDPAQITTETLQAAIGRVALCALIARHWPSKGSRQNTALALAGFLVGARLPETTIVALIETAARLAGDEEWPTRGETVRTTILRMSADAPIAGAGALATLLRDGDAVVGLMRRWLGLHAHVASETQYFATPDGLFWRRPTQGATVRVRLTNFSARIVADLTEDDGVERSHQYEIEASLGGPSARTTVPATQFHAMAWPMELLGAGAVVYPGLSLRDHARGAIQLLSGIPGRRDVYTHLGWRRVGTDWVYLHAGGAIGGSEPARGVEVRPPEALARFVLPSPPSGTELTEAVSASLRLIELGPDRIMIPLVAAVARSVLGPADFSLHLAGRTGAGKTELAALAQQHFGSALGARHLPSSWSSTGNALEGLAFAAKDALLVVDDFSPTGAAWDIQRYHREADRLFRAQGNNTGRQRMRADATLKPAKAPRGLILSTGEDIPRGHSLRSRLLVIEVSPSDLAWSRLSGCQEDGGSGRYAQTLAAFIHWLAPQYETIRQRARADVQALRQAAFRSNQHRRTATIVADLAAGWRLFLEFARAAEAVGVASAGDLWIRGWDALGTLAMDQARHQRVSEPPRLFLELLGGAVASGRAHVAGKDGNEPDTPTAWGWRAVTIGTGDNERVDWRPGGDCLGWVDGEDLYLDPHAAFAAAQRFGKDGGEQIPIALHTLTRRLSEQKFLVSREEDRGVFTVRKTLGGKRREVLHLAAEVLTAQEPDQPDQDPRSHDAGGAPGSTPTSGSVEPDPAPGPSSTSAVGMVGSTSSGEAAVENTLASSGPILRGSPGGRARTRSADGIDQSGWPPELPGRGPRHTDGFSRCSGCDQGTWVTFGGVPFCRPCALREHASAERTKTSRSKSSGGSSGTALHGGAEQPSRSAPEAPCR